jgi:UDP-glucose 4-epimerase
MRVVVTGGCGFVGVNLAHLLVRGGHEVVAFDNFVLGRPAHLEGLDIEIVEGDLRDPDALRAVMRGAEAVVHLAADTRVIPSIEDPRFNFDNNVLGTFNLLEAMRAEGVARLVNASTGGAILGEVTPPVHEEMVPRPISPYGASKLACEGYLSAYAGCYGMQAASLRFSNVYGPRSYHKGSVVAHFIKRILAGETLVVYGDGSQARDYILVDDLCRGIAMCLEQGATGVIQMGTGVPTSLDDLIALLRGIAEADGYRVRVRHEDFRAGEIRDTYGRVDRARALLGFEARTPLAEGLAQTWAWFRGAAPAS